MAGLAFGMILLGSMVAGTIYFFAFRNVVIAPYFPAIFQPIIAGQKKCLASTAVQKLSPMTNRATEILFVNIIPVIHSK